MAQNNMNVVLNNGNVVSILKDTKTVTKQKLLNSLTDVADVQKLSHMSKANIIAWIAEHCQPWYLRDSTIAASTEAIRRSYSVVEVAMRVGCDESTISDVNGFEFAVLW